MATPRYGHTATLLPDGEVLIAGGFSGSNYLASVEIYAPESDTWRAGAPMSTPRFGHSASLLPSGDVLVTGGYSGTYLASAEIYDPTADRWQPVASMASSRYLHTATRLLDGRVVVVVGFAGVFPLASAEVFDSANETWQSIGSMSTGRVQHAASLIGGGVLVVGGQGFHASLDSAELYDPVTNSWTLTASMSSRRQEHTATYVEGRILIAGGRDGSNYLASAETFDISSGGWTALSSMSAARYGHSATALADGRVLLAGGFGAASYPAPAELFDPAANIWSATPDLSMALYRPSATLLETGNVLVAGGLNAGVAQAATYLYSISMDTIPPTVTGIPDGTPNEFGWYNGPVTINWVASDPEPASPPVSDPPDTIAAAEGAHIVYESDPACDAATPPNCATGSVTLSIDLTQPVINSLTLQATTLRSGETTVLAGDAGDTLSCIVDGEWFLGSDPGVGNGQPLEAGDESFGDCQEAFQAIVTAGPIPGASTVGARARDKAGNWSAVASTSLQILPATVAPKIESVTPERAVPGDQVTIRGTGFGPPPVDATLDGYADLTLDRDPLAPAMWNDSQIEFVVPPLAPGIYTLLVVTSGGSAEKRLEILGPDPIIDSIDPRSGPAGTTVLLTGHNFGQAGTNTMVRVGSSPAQIFFWTTRRISFRVPVALSDGQYPVTVITESGATAEGTFRIRPLVLGVEYGACDESFFGLLSESCRSIVVSVTNVRRSATGTTIDLEIANIRPTFYEIQIGIMGSPSPAPMPFVLFPNRTRLLKDLAVTATTVIHVSADATTERAVGMLVADCLSRAATGKPFPENLAVRWLEMSLAAASPLSAWTHGAVVAFFENDLEGILGALTDLPKLVVEDPILLGQLKEFGISKSHVQGLGSPALLFQLGSVIIREVLTLTSPKFDNADLVAN